MHSQKEYLRKSWNRSRRRAFERAVDALLHRSLAICWHESSRLLFICLAYLRNDVRLPWTCILNVVFQTIQQLSPQRYQATSYSSRRTVKALRACAGCPPGSGDCSVAIAAYSATAANLGRLCWLQPKPPP